MLKAVRRALFLLPPAVAILGVWLAAQLLTSSPPRPTLTFSSSELVDLVRWAARGSSNEAGRADPFPAAAERAPRILATLYRDHGAASRLLLEDPSSEVRRNAFLALLREERTRAPHVHHLKVEIQVTGEDRQRVLFGPALALQLDHGLDGLILKRPGETSVVHPTQPIELGLAPRQVYEALLAPELDRGARLYRFRTEAAVLRLADGRVTHMARNQPANGPEVHVANLERAICAGADFIARHQCANGRFRYLFNAVTDEDLSGYCAVRHAGTTFALYQASRTLGEPRHLEAAEQALAWLVDDRVRHARGVSYVMSGRTVKLGAAALALLALCERAAILPDGKFDDLMLSFGAFIEQQMDDSGALSSYYAWSDQPAPDRVSVYYPGEATFALAALYRVTDDPKWLRLAVRAAGHLIRRGKFLGVDLVVFPDAWLLCALASLYGQTADPSLLDYAERIADSMLAVQYLDENAPATAGGYLDPVFPRSTTAAVCAEGLGMLCRALLRRGDAARAEKYTSALLLTTGFQLRQQVTGQNDFFYLDPEGVRGGFFASAVDHRMRIDYTQHTLSSFVYALDVLRKVVR